MRNITKLRRNSRALSPIFATLILIAIAVIAGIVVYMFTSGTIAGLTSGGTAGQEKAAVQGVTAASTGATATVYASYVSGGTPIDITGAIIRNANGITSVGTAADQLTTDGALVQVDVTGIAPALTPGDTYTLTLTSAKGGSFTSSSFTVPAAPAGP